MGDTFNIPFLNSMKVPLQGNWWTGQKIHEKIALNTKYHNKFPFNSKGRGNQLSHGVPKPQTYRYVWHQTFHLATSTSSLLIFKSTVWFNKCDLFQSTSSSEPDRPGCQCLECTAMWAVFCPASQGAFQCLQQLPLTHQSHRAGLAALLISGKHHFLLLNSNVAREHSHFRTESPSLWHRSADSVLQTLCSSWELVSVCLHGAVWQTQLCSPGTNYSFFCWAPWAELCLPPGHAEMSVCTYLFFGSLIFAR